MAKDNTFLLTGNELKGFLEIGKSLSSEKDTVRLLEKIILSSIDITSSDGGTIYLVIEKKSGNWSYININCCIDRLLKFVIARNTSIDLKLETTVIPITVNSISGFSVITGESLRIDDVYNIDPQLGCRHDRSYDENTGYLTKSMLSIPMKDHKDSVIGVIQLINKKKNKSKKIDYTDKASMEDIISYDHSDEMLMNSLAGQAAVALENNNLYREMKDLLQEYRIQNEQLTILSRKILKAHEEERKRVAREIHDGPAQSSASLSLKVEICKKHFQLGNYGKLTAEMEQLSAGIRSVVKEIRTIIYDLRPSYLDDGLKAALESRMNVFGDTSGIKVDFNASGDDSKIEYYMSSTVYRIVQEALSNIIKHAGAKYVMVDFNIGEKAINLSITDNGKGFDISDLSGKKPEIEGGFGLESIRERVELVKGRMSIVSEPGAGTKLDIEIPLF